jgi:hypothetical protein
MRSRNHCYRGNSISITGYECVNCVSVAYVIQHAKRVRVIYRHLWSSRLCSIYDH